MLQGQNERFEAGRLCDAADFYRWRRRWGMNRDQLKRLKELEKENGRLRRAVSDLTLDKMILTEAARETSEPFAPSQMHRPHP